MLTGHLVEGNMRAIYIVLASFLLNLKLFQKNVIE